jgi:hypothetical protein
MTGGIGVVPVQAAGSSSLKGGFVRWARETVPARGLSRGQAQVLKELASRADRDGCCYPSVRAIAQGVVLSERHTKRLLGELTELGLVLSHHRGRGRSAHRQLCPHAPLPVVGGQLSFDDLLAQSVPAAYGPAAAKEGFIPPSPVVGVPLACFGVPSDGPQKYQTEEKEGAAAREHVLEEHLHDVLAVLEGAPGLVVEPMSVNSALAAYPQAAGHDHLRAAHTVASYAFEGGLRVPAANRLLLAELRKQTKPVAGSPTTTSRGGGERWHEGRRRPVPAGKPQNEWDRVLQDELRRLRGSDSLVPAGWT